MKRFFFCTVILLGSLAYMTSDNAETYSLHQESPTEVLTPSVTIDLYIAEPTGEVVADVIAVIVEPTREGFSSEVFHPPAAVNV